MMSGLSTLLSTKCSNVMFLTIPPPTPGPAQHLIRAPFCALDILTFLKFRIMNVRKCDSSLKHVELKTTAHNVAGRTKDADDGR